MTIARATTLWCDRCGASVDVDPKQLSPLLDPAARGWVAVDDAHHLCPPCAIAYREKKAALADELARFAVGG